MRHVWVDFNDVSTNNKTTTLRNEAPDAEVGDDVLCYDHDGNTMRGFIYGVGPKLMVIHLVGEFQPGRDS